jgi:hypothetical protein
MQARRGGPAEICEAALALARVISSVGQKHMIICKACSKENPDCMINCLDCGRKIAPSAAAAQSTVYHKAANYAVMAVVGSIVLNITVLGALFSADPLFRRISSLLVGIVLLSAIPAGIVALCGIRKCGKSGLLGKGLAGVLIPILLIAMAVPAFLKVRQISIQKRVEQVATEITRETPKMIDEVTRLDKATVDGANEITVDFTITSFAGKDVDKKKWDDLAVPMLKANIKNSIFGSLLKQGVGVKYRYHGNDGIFFAELVFDPKDYK